MNRTALLLATATLIAGLVVGAAIGGKDVAYWKDRATKNDAAFRLQQNVVGQLRTDLLKAREAYKELKAIGEHNAEADAHNQQAFRSIKELNIELASRLQFALARCGARQ